MVPIEYLRAVLDLAEAAEAAAAADQCGGADAWQDWVLNIGSGYTEDTRYLYAAAPANMVPALKHAIACMERIETLQGASSFPPG